MISLFTDTIRDVRGAGGADADRGLDGRQRRDPGADGHRAGAGDAQPRAPRTSARFIGREGLVGLINGVGFALLIGVLAGSSSRTPGSALVIATAMIGNMVVAGFAGVLIPIALEKLEGRPALASGTFVTTITDVFGFFAFLGLAGILLVR